MLSYSEQYKIRTSELDYRDNMRLSAYLDLFQTIAGKHAELLGLGYEEMLKKGIAWVITKVKFDCILPLLSDETVTVVTEPHERGLMDFTRDYYIYKQSGKLAAKGTSQWVHIDFATRKLVEPQADFNGEFTTRSAYPSRRIERIKPIDTPAAYAHEIVRSDLDHNGHTNNIRYADMIFDSVNLPSPPTRAIINFHSESRLGDRIDVSHAAIENSLIFTGRKNGDVCFTARLFFNKNID